jgi:hypothetical protein
MAFGEDGKRCGSGGFQGFGQSGRVEGIANDSARWRSGLEFGQNMDALAEKGGGEIADRRGSLYSVFECGFGKNVLAMLDFGASRVEDSVEDGSGVSVGSHGWKFVC